MQVLAVLCLVLATHWSLPASQSTRGEVMPRLQLAYLVEDGQYRLPEVASAQGGQAARATRQRSGSRVKRQQQPTVESQDPSRSQEQSQTPRSADFSVDVARILAAAGAGPSPIDPDSRSYQGRRRRRSPQIEPPHNSRRRRSPQIEPPHSNAHQYGLQEPKVDTVKVKSHGNVGKVVQAPVVVARKNQADFLNGAKERRRRSDSFIPFSVYDNRRIKTLKVEENDFHALPVRLQIERQSRALQLQLTHTLSQAGESPRLTVTH